MQLPQQRRASAFDVRENQKFENVRRSDESCGPRNNLVYLLLIANNSFLISLHISTHTHQFPESAVLRSFLFAFSLSVGLTNLFLVSESGSVLIFWSVHWRLKIRHRPLMAKIHIIRKQSGATSVKWEKLKFISLSCSPLTRTQFGLAKVQWPIIKHASVIFNICAKPEQEPVLAAAIIMTNKFAKMSIFIYFHISSV